MLVILTKHSHREDRENNDANFDQLQVIFCSATRWIVRQISPSDELKTLTEVMTKSYKKMDQI